MWPESNFYFPHISLNSIINWFFHGREPGDGAPKWNEDWRESVEFRDGASWEAGTRESGLRRWKIEGRRMSLGRFARHCYVAVIAAN